MAKKTFSLTAPEIQERYGIDLITAEVIRNSFIQITRQMHATLLRGSYSPIIRDYMDMAVCVFLINQGQDGPEYEMVAVTEGCTQHAFNQQYFVNAMLNEYGLENMRPGDVLISNDTFRGGIHLSDLGAVSVVFCEGKPSFVVSNVAHWADMGGAAPGSFLNGWAVESYQEGLRIPPMLIYAEGVPVRTAFNLLIENTRIPHYVLGDMRAQCGTLVVGTRLVGNMVDKLGLEVSRNGAQYSIDYVQRISQQAISEFPDGVYEAEDWMDDDGIELEPVKTKVTVTIRGDKAEIDLSGSQRQPLGNTTSGWGAEATRLLIGFKTMLEPASPVNAGSFKQIDVISPSGTVHNGLPPTSTNFHADPGCRAYNSIYKALSHAMPERGVASDYGTCNAYLWGGLDTRPGRIGTPWIYYIIAPGGWGGTARTDGVPFCLVSYGNCYDPVVELIEQECPVIVLDKEFTMDSAGAGEHRGGPGTCVTYLALSDTTMTAGADRVRFPPPGEQGGGAAMPVYGYFLEDANVSFKHTRNGITPARFMKPLFGLVDADGRPDPSGGVYCLNTLAKSGKFSLRPVKAGTIFRNYCSGGGGFGDSLRRPVNLVLKDVENELLSPEFAANAYGVVVNPATMKVDEKVTEERRRILAAQREQGKWSVPVACYPNWPK